MVTLDDVGDRTTEEESPFSPKVVVRWLLFWFAIALAIRFINLAAKPAWMDEVSTVLFSLGNSSRLIPTDQVISLDQILRALQVTPGANAQDVVVNLLSENNHPPAYFVLAHWWMRLFPRADGYASLWAARALPALLGALAVPMTYLLGWLSFRDRQIPIRQTRLIGLMGAALMAVSPFSVFLSQESRHYTLAILAIMASLCCFVQALKAVWQHQSLSWITVLVWVIINALSISVHYFCGIALCAEGLVLLVLLVRQCLKEGSRWRRTPWPSIYVAALGSLAGVLIWLPIVLTFYGSPQTTYITSGQSSWKFWVDPIVQSIVGWLYAILSPITSGYYGWLAIAVIATTSALLVFFYTPWLTLALKRSLQFQWAQPGFRPGFWAIGGFFVMGNLLFLGICYGLGFDITRGHRYSFVYFPSLLILVGASLAPFWQASTECPFAAPSLEHSLKKPKEINPFSQVKLPFVKRFISGRTFVATVIIVGFLGTQAIVYDASHLKFYKANRMVNFVRETSTLPVVIGTNAPISDQPTVIGNEIVSLAWEVRRQLEAGIDPEGWVSVPKFVIAEKNLVTDSDPVVPLIQSLKAVPRPFELWLLNMSPSLAGEDCVRPSDNSGGSKGSFHYARYICENQP